MAEIAALDLKRITKLLPPRAAPEQDFAMNHFMLSQLVDLARELEGIQRTWKPVDYEIAAQHARATAIGSRAGSVVMNAAVGHLRYHANRLIAAVAAYENGLARLTQFEEKVAADLAALGDLPAVEGSLPPDRLPPMEPTPPRRESTSYTSFDPREPAPRPASGPTVVALGDRDGYRVKGGA